MKNKITGFALILAGCAVIYALALSGLFGKHIDLADFFKGFALGVGVIAGSALVAVLVKKAKESADTEKV